jgi:hypothetical protein
MSYEDEAPRPDYVEVQMGSSKGESAYSSSDRLLTNVHCNSHYSTSTPSILVISMLKETSASRRFVWCAAHHTPCNDVPIGYRSLGYSVVRY